MCEMVNHDQACLSTWHMIMIMLKSYVNGTIIKRFIKYLARSIQGSLRFAEESKYSFAEHKTSSTALE